MNINRVFALFLALVVFSSGLGIGAAAEITVQPGQSIQDALNSSVSGDEIIISPGNYADNLRITTGDITVRSASGNPEDTIVTAASPAEDVFYVEASNVTITGLGINGAGYDRAGVYLIRSNNCIIENNEFLNNALGIYLKNSTYNLILNNTAAAGKRAVNVERSNYNTISGNNVSDQRFGIYFLVSEANIASNNQVSGSADHGIVLESCSDTSL